MGVRISRSQLKSLGIEVSKSPGERRQAGVMNKLEEKFAAHLELLKYTGIVKAWWFESQGLRLADRTFYYPDFLVCYVDDRCPIEVIEAKGFWKDDALVKIKVAAEMYPCFRFRAVQLVKKEWKFREFSDVR